MSFRGFFTGRFGWAAGSAVLWLEGINLAVSGAMGLNTGADRLEAGANASWGAVLAQETGKHFLYNHVRFARFLGEVFTSADAGEFSDNTQIYFSMNGQSEDLQIIAADPDNQNLVSFAIPKDIVPEGVDALQGMTMAQLREVLEARPEVGARASTEPARYLEQDGLA